MKKSDIAIWVVGISVVLFVIYAVTGGQDVTLPPEWENPKNKTTTTKSTTPKKASFWKRYDPSLKARIDSSNCYDLQKEFNNAADNSDRQRARTGVGNLDLMEYIQNRLQKKGCN
tara:strand:+ start:34 stop:378 length:345 start_codon:yes stop_codon:yes gene_type:complete